MMAMLRRFIRIGFRERSKRESDRAENALIKRANMTGTRQRAALQPGRICAVQYRILRGKGRATRCQRESKSSLTGCSSYVPINTIISLLIRLIGVYTAF